MKKPVIAQLIEQGELEAIQNHLTNYPTPITEEDFQATIKSQKIKIILVLHKEIQAKNIQLSKETFKLAVQYLSYPFLGEDLQSRSFLNELLKSAPEKFQQRQKRIDELASSRKGNSISSGSETDTSTHVRNDIKAIESMTEQGGLITTSHLISLFQSSENDKVKLNQAEFDLLCDIMIKQKLPIPEEIWGCFMPWAKTTEKHILKLLDVMIKTGSVVTGGSLVQAFNNQHADALLKPLIAAIRQTKGIIKTKHIMALILKTYTALTYTTPDKNDILKKLNYLNTVCELATDQQLSMDNDFIFDHLPFYSNEISKILITLLNTFDKTNSPVGEKLFEKTLTLLQTKIKEVQNHDSLLQSFVDAKWINQFNPTKLEEILNSVNTTQAKKIVFSAFLSSSFSGRKMTAKIEDFANKHQINIAELLQEELIHPRANSHNRFDAGEKLDEQYFESLKVKTKINQKSSPLIYALTRASLSGKFDQTKLEKILKSVPTDQIETVFAAFLTSYLDPITEEIEKFAKQYNVNINNLLNEKLIQERFDSFEEYRNIADFHHDVRQIIFGLVHHHINLPLTIWNALEGKEVIDTKLLEPFMIATMQNTNGNNNNVMTIAQKLERVINIVGSKHTEAILKQYVILNNDFFDDELRKLANHYGIEDIAKLKNPDDYKHKREMVSSALVRGIFSPNSPLNALQISTAKSGCYLEIVTLKPNQNISLPKIAGKAFSENKAVYVLVTEDYQNYQLYRYTASDTYDQVSIKNVAGLASLLAKQPINTNELLESVTEYEKTYNKFQRDAAETILNFAY